MNPVEVKEIIRYLLNSTHVISISIQYETVRTCIPNEFNDRLMKDLLEKKYIYCPSVGDLFHKFIEERQFKWAHLLYQSESVIPTTVDLCVLVSKPGGNRDDALAFAQWMINDHHVSMTDVTPSHVGDLDWDVYDDAKQYLPHDDLVRMYIEHSPK